MGEKLRNRSRTLDSKYARNRMNQEDVLDVDEYDIENISLEIDAENCNIEHDIDIEDAGNKASDVMDNNKVTKKKSNFEQFLQRLKGLLMKETKYDLRKDPQEKINNSLNREEELVKRTKSSKLQSQV